MSRGIQAVIMLVCIVLAVSTISTLGLLSSVDAGKYDTQADQDVNRIVEVLEDQGSSTTGAAELNPIVTLTFGALDTLQIMWIIVSDTSELVMLFIPIPVIANSIETMARVALGLTVLYFVRGVVL